MKCVLVLAVVVLAVQAAPASWIKLQEATLLQKGVGDIWSNCSKSTDKAHILNVKITPDPPQKGKNVTVFADVLLDEELTAGKIAVKLKYGIIPVYDKTLDLCETLKEANVDCPVKAGKYQESITETIPGVIPSGHYTGNAMVTDQNGDEVACIDIDLHF